MNAPIMSSPNASSRPGQSLVIYDPAERPPVRGIMRVAWLALAGFIAFFMLWSVLAPLHSAAIASGVLRADGGGRKVVQHLEGGIIKEILVRDGQSVKAGQVLVVLDNTQSGARDSALQTAYDTLLAQDARLTAERLGRSGVVYPVALKSRAGDESVRAIMAASDAVFQTRRGAMVDQIRIMQQRIQQARAEINASSAQVDSLAEQNRLLDEERQGVAGLVEQGLERKSRLLALQRQQSATIGQREQTIGSQARLNEAIGESRAQISFLRGQQASEAAAQQREVQANLADLTEKINVSRDVSSRRQVTAPVDGTVVNLRVVTLGAVVGPGQPIVDIVPANEKIVVSARVKANDVDVVHQGLVAEIKLTPYKARTMPMLRGSVREISADAAYDEKSNSLYYETEIVLDEKELKKLHDVHLVSGMPAEVFINLGSQSLMQYLFQPLIDSFQRAFREP